MCLEVTCGATGDGASLADRGAACVDGACDKCGFAALWTNGLRKSLVEGTLEDGVEALKEDIDEVWYEPLAWSRYSYRTKEGAPKHARRRGADEDEDWELSKKSKELYIENCKGTLVDFLDEFVAVAEKHVIHRSILER